MSRLVVGLSGFSYKPWQGEDRFYPVGLKQKEFLGYYATRYSGVEMDSTWYRMPSKESIEAWIAGTPDDFRFTFKAHRNISHVSRLKPDCFDSVDFLTERLKPMRDAGRLGCIFVQLPPNFKKNAERLSEFIAHLDEDYPWGIEFRNATWNDDETEAILREAGVTWVSWDTDDEAGVRRDSGKVIYARMRRDAYDDETMADWAGWFKSRLESGKECLVFFKHEDEGSPWVDADRMVKLLG